jgi:RNA polymerase sigma factor (sigma-70 family)
VCETDAATLTRAVASGDTEAFARFYGQWFDTMYAMARRCTGRDESFCLDVVQEAMMRVIRSLKPMSHEMDLRRWLSVVVRSCALDLLRRELRQRKRYQEPFSGKRCQEPLSEMAEQIAWLRRQLHDLPADDARLLSMRFRFGWTLERIGRALGLKPGAVDGRLTRSIAALKERATEDFDELSR